MEDNIKMQIAFPKSDEDHRLQLVNINGSMFAILFAPLESNGPINLFCETWSLVLLAPIKSKKDVVISAINVICLNEIVSEEGSVNIQASNQLVKFAHTTKNITEKGEREFQFGDDPTVFMYFYRLFESVIDHGRNKVVDSLSEAQKQFIVALCALHDKIEGTPEKRDLKKVLQLWGIPLI